MAFLFSSTLNKLAVNFWVEYEKALQCDKMHKQFITFIHFNKA